MTKKQRLIKEKEQEIRETEMRLDELRQQRKMLDDFPDLDYDDPNQIYLGNAFEGFEEKLEKAKKENK